MGVDFRRTEYFVDLLIEQLPSLASNGYPQLIFVYYFHEN